jgi:hypothetical protein
MKIRVSSRVWSSIVATMVAAFGVTACGSSDGATDDGSGDEAAPATTSEDLRAGCHWERLPGPCRDPGVGSQRCVPAVRGNAHWIHICPPHNACEQNGGTCVPLVPDACAEGNAGGFSCGGGLGVMCCMPI